MAKLTLNAGVPTKPARWGLAVPMTNSCCWSRKFKTYEPMLTTAVCSTLISSCWYGDSHKEKSKVVFLDMVIHDRRQKVAYWHLDKVIVVWSEYGDYYGKIVFKIWVKGVLILLIMKDQNERMLIAFWCLRHNFLCKEKSNF